MENPSSYIAHTQDRIYHGNHHNIVLWVYLWVSPLILMQTVQSSWSRIQCKFMFTLGWGLDKVLVNPKSVQKPAYQIQTLLNPLLNLYRFIVQHLQVAKVISGNQKYVWRSWFMNFKLIILKCCHFHKSVDENSPEIDVSWSAQNFLQRRLATLDLLKLQKHYLMPIVQCCDRVMFLSPSKSLWGNADTILQGALTKRQPKVSYSCLLI